MNDDVESDVGHQHEVHPFGKFCLSKFHCEEYWDNGQNMCNISPANKLKNQSCAKLNREPYPSQWSQLNSGRRLLPGWGLLNTSRMLILVTMSNHPIIVLTWRRPQSVGRNTKRWLLCLGLRVGYQPRKTSFRTIEHAQLLMLFTIDHPLISTKIMTNAANVKAHVIIMQILCHCKYINILIFGG